MVRKPITFPSDPRQLLERAQREFDSGHLTEAIGLLEQVVAGDTDTTDIRTMLAIACARTRQVERAFAHLERALELDETAFRPHCAIGELYLRLCVPAKAREHLSRALECATRAEERSYVQSLLHEERARDRRRLQRPTFDKPFWRPWQRRSARSDP